MKAIPHPERVLFNGSLAVSGTVHPTATAVAVSGGRILAMGSDKEMLAAASANTEKTDLENRLVVPGFMDAHIHFYEWAMKRQGLKLDDIDSLEQLLARVKKAAGTQPEGQWIVGQGWNETDWQQPVMPTRKTLDAAARNHPVLLWRCDLHLAAANTAALRLADIGPDTPDPPEGKIERDNAGMPTGILRELAINLVRKAMAAPGADGESNAFEEAANALHRRGITGIHDIRLMEDPDGATAFRIFQKLDRENRLPLRAWVSLPGHNLDNIIGLGLQTGFGNERLRIGHVKYFSDGGMGARTAWMTEPYKDAETGMPLMDMKKLAEDIRKADEAGLSVMVHAVGDRANRELVTIFEALESRRRDTGTPPPVLPHRIEHVQMLRPQDAARLARLKVATCVTPANMLLDINLIDKALEEDGRWTYAFRQLWDTGVPVMFSSDCPVCDPDPLLGIHAAVTRTRPDGTPEGGWYPESRLTMAEALNACTSIPAASHHAKDIGVIAPGKKADLAVLSKNILSPSPPDLTTVSVDMTLFDGRIVFRKF